MDPARRVVSILFTLRWNSVDRARQRCNRNHDERALLLCYKVTFCWLALESAERFAPILRYRYCMVKASTDEGEVQRRLPINIRMAHR